MLHIEQYTENILPTADIKDYNGVIDGESFFV